MAHIVGTILPVSPLVVIGPDSGLPPTSPNTWAFDLDPGPPPPGGIKFIIVHLQGLNLPANNRVEIDLGYDKDVITTSFDSEFWSRPVNLSAFANGKVQIRYITSGAATGGATLDRFGRGERHDGDGDPTSNSNCDPFLVDASYAEPTFNTSLFCATPPDFENVECVTAAGDIRKTVAPSVGMIVHVDRAADGVTEIVSSLSGTLVGTDLVLTAAQALVLTADQLKSASIIFNYQTTCPGARPGNYAGRFHKVKRIVKLGFFGAVDYALLQLTVPAAGLGIPPVVMRPDLPAAGEQIFCIHHPEGAVKRLSAKHAAFKTVISSDLNAVVADLDVASGSIGAGLFDASGRVVGVMSTGTPCNIAFYPTAGALADIGNPQDDPLGRDVMIVFDRSGSMSLDAGTGRTKIEEARDAAALFIQLVQSDGANQIGLVSFSTAASNPVDFTLQPVNAANKLALTGPAPFTGGIVGGIVADGTTSIGDGLEAARDQMLSPNTSRSILLLTDGLQNTPPLIADVTGLDGINISAVGFGAASSLNGALLTELSETHNGIYMRAGDGLDLKKFFALAFGNIFAAGALLDPPGRLNGRDKESKPIRFNVCGENAITIVVGWNKAEAELAITAKTPGGAAITGSSSGVGHATGRTWAFLRIKLPYGGERNGSWSVSVSRAGGGLGAAGPIDYFINVIAGGGAKAHALAWARSLLYRRGHQSGGAAGRRRQPRRQGAPHGHAAGCVGRHYSHQSKKGAGAHHAERRHHPVAPHDDARDRKVDPQADRRLRRAPLRPQQRSSADQCHGEKRRAARCGAERFSQRRRHLHLPRGRDLRQGLRQLTRAAMVGRGRGGGRSDKIGCDGNDRRDASGQEEGGDLRHRPARFLRQPCRSRPPRCIHRHRHARHGADRRRARQRRRLLQRGRRQ